MYINKLLQSKDEITCSGEKKADGQAQGENVK